MVGVVFSTLYTDYITVYHKQVVIIMQLALCTTICLLGYQITFLQYL